MLQRQTLERQAEEDSHVVCMHVCMHVRLGYSDCIFVCTQAHMLEAATAEAQGHHPCMVGPDTSRASAHAQAVCATAIAQLIKLCLGRKPSPVDKLLKNLCTMAWGDPTETAAITAADCTAPSMTGSTGGSHKESLSVPPRP